MNKSMRYLVFSFLFAAVGFGVYSLMNKSAVCVEENTQVAAEVVDSTNAIEVASAEAPKAEEVIGDVAKEGEAKVEGEVKKDDAAEEPAVEEEETEEVTEETKL